VRFGTLFLPILFWGCQPSSDALPYPLTISEEGVGSVHLGGSFDIALLRGKLPGFELELLSEVASAKSSPIIRLKRGGKEIALLVSDPKGSILTEVIILSPRVKNTQGIGINDLLPDTEAIRCIRDKCRYSNNSSVTYRIEPGSRTIREITLQKL